MSAALSELLAPQVVVRLISLLLKGRGNIGNWVGFHPTTYNEDSVSVSGPNTTRSPAGSVRTVTYRIFNETRVPMKATSPGSAPTTTAANPMAVNTVNIARFHQKIPLNYELLGNMSAMIGPNSQIDTGGQQYIAQQQKYLVSQGNTLVEFLAAGMMRDSIYFINAGTIPGGGTDWRPSFTAPSGTQIGFQVNMQVPSGNKSQLDMLGTGSIIGTSWANTAAPIPADIWQIQAAYAQLNRMAMNDVWINHLMWNNIVTNTDVRNLAGSSNTPFAAYDMQAAPTGFGPPAYTATIRGVPDVTWHFDDDTIAIGADTDPINSQGTATLTKKIPDTMAIFTTDPKKNDWCTLYEGGEYVVERTGSEAQLRMGWYMWSLPVAQPSILELIALFNGSPALFVPSAVAPASVVFP